VVFYLNASKTCGMWMESIWALNNKKRMIFYAEPGVRLSLYTRWLVGQVHSEWITDIEEFGKALNKQISQVYRSRLLGNIFDVLPLDDTVTLLEEG